MDEPTTTGDPGRGSLPSQQRGRDRRVALLRAALELLAEGGIKAVTHRAVAARAGLPLASTTYYFTSIDQLTEEALLLGVEERVALLQTFLVPGALRAREPDQLARTYVGAVVARPTADILAQLEVYLEAARNPALRQGAAAAIKSFEVLAERALATVGAGDARATAIAVSAMLDGFALHRVVRPLPADFELDVMLNALRALFVAHIASDAELAEWQAGLVMAFKLQMSDTTAAVPSRSMPPG